jgi:DNA-directed RNA polymerase I, II, and III subunit RPABC5
MLIPVKCFTCGEVIADKYRWYLAEVRKRKLPQDMNADKVVYLTKENAEK